MTEDNFLTTDEVLDYLHINLRTVYRLIKAGQGYQAGDARAYELKYKDQILRALRKRAAGLGFELVELPQAA